MVQGFASSKHDSNQFLSGMRMRNGEREQDRELNLKGGGRAGRPKAEPYNCLALVTLRALCIVDADQVPDWAIRKRWQAA